MNLVINRELAKAERGMTVLATVASASVFVGLFGTVWGIMNAFRAIAVSQKKTDAKSLPSQTEPITISVNAAGEIFIQETEIALDDVATRLVAISNNGYDERIYLRGDGQANYEAVMKVMARVNAAGFSNLGLVTDPVSAGN